MKELLLVLILLTGCAKVAPTNPPMLGNSNVSWLQKVQDGVIFNETFECDNFIAADGWTILQGNPANSSNQYNEGIKSWDNSANNQSIPVASKSFSYTPPPDGTTMLVCVWFYDDVSHTTEHGPYAQVKYSTGNYLTIGVRNSVSTTHYSYSSSTNSTDAPTTSTGVSRSTGWHLFWFEVNTNISGLQLGIDTTNFASGVGNGIINQVALYADKVGGSGNSFGYFDALGVYKSSLLEFDLPDSLNLVVYDKNNNEITGGTEFDVINTLGFSQSPFPANISVEVPLGSTNPWVSMTAYRSPLLKINPGDIYQFNQIAFGQQITDPNKIMSGDVETSGLVNRNLTNSGIQETIQYGLKDKVTFMAKDLYGETWKRQVDNWFQNAVQGFPFSLMIADVTENAFGVLSGPATGTDITIMPNIAFEQGGNSTDPFITGNFYVVRDQANTQKQTLQLVSKTSTVLTFDQNVNVAVAQGDYCYSKYFYPFLEVADKTLQGFKLSDPMLIRYDWTQSCFEYNS